MRFLAFLPLGAILLLGAYAQEPAHPRVLTGVTPGMLAGHDAGFWQAVSRAEVIYVGEIHDNPGDHRFEAGLIKALARNRVPFVVGWEMFDRSQQPALDAWQRGELTRTQLFQQTGFQRAWAAYSPWYARILDETRRSAVRNLALNARPALVHKVSQGTPLTSAETRELPRGFSADEGALRNFTRMMGTHPGMARSSLKRFFDAQSLWDQTMASVILEFHAREPQTKVVVLTGRGHVERGYGVPYFVKQKAHLEQLVLLP
ncbi:MAG: ChaN family lipoprotein [Verrucomicrobia bacterium]|nr:ChaN family lipoprotein [Verrucomicrobiota bacterium]